MKHRSLDRLCTPTLLLWAALGCNDQRLRDLGYTLTEQGQAAPPEPLEEDPYDCPPSAADERITADAVTSAVARDLAAAASEDRPFLRYASLANALNAERCSSTVELARSALAKLLNGVSREPTLTAPVALPGGEHPYVLRLDLRDYGLDREIALGGETHRDGWEAWLASTPYDVALGGEEGAFLAAETGTTSAWLSVDAIIEAATGAELYYALVGIPATLGELRELVGLPRALDPFRDGLPRAATSVSRVLRAQGNMRAIDRYTIADGAYYEALQVDTTALLADPLHVQPAAQRLAAFNLPNGLLAFAAMDAAGARIGAPELLLDANRDDFQSVVLESCVNCHAQGFIPVTDDLGPAILGNPDLFSAEAVEAYASGPGDAARLEQLQADGRRHLDALEALSVSTQGSDPISAVSVRVSREVEASVAAADLLVAPEMLRERLGELPPELLPLGVGLRVSRARFGALYAQAFCVLHAGDANPPTACE